ncbi:MAG: acyl-CoA synthetase [Pseudomonadota bacterium]
MHVATYADKEAVEQQMSFAERLTARSLYQQLSQTTDAFADRPAMSFQIKSGPKDKAETLTWGEVKARTTAAANMFRAHGVGEGDVVAYVLPNCTEAPITLLAGATAGIVNPVNPLLDAETIGGILRETGAKAVVTLAPFPKTDVAQKVAAAVALAPEVKTVFQVDLKRYLSPPLSWIVPLIRPKADAPGAAKVLDFQTELARHPSDALSFADHDDDRFCACFHTGGTTGLPKVAQHRASGILYNGWCGHSYMFTEQDVLMAPLPMFHVLAAYPLFMSCLVSGASMVMPTPQGYRGDGVFENFWKLVERYKATFLITVPTAAAKLMQTPVDADVSTLRYAISGSAPLPMELISRFETATGLKILEGYGMTEATCLVSINPPHGERKAGSVGLPFPYTDVKIFDCGSDGAVNHECGVDEIGEICVSNPGVIVGNTYREADKNVGLYAREKYLRTGDLGRIDPDGFVWITGRAKDLIIRGGHNIDPATIEEAMMTHPQVAFAGAIGQPDLHSGELPCAYVELIEGATVSQSDLMDHALSTIGERAAQPRHLEVLDELPKTAVGKVFKPDLRRMAITRVFNDVLESAGAEARVKDVREDKKRGLVALLSPGPSGARNDSEITALLGGFARPWDWA